MSLSIFFLLLLVAVIVWFFTNKSIRKIVKIISGIAFTGFIGLVLWWFWLFDIEDRYGDHSNIFYDAKNGKMIYIIDNATNDTIIHGTVKKTWNKMYILPPQSFDKIELGQILLKYDLYRMKIIYQ